MADRLKLQRYSINFVIDFHDEDVKNVGQLPWFLMLGDAPIPIEWLEYVAVRQLEGDEGSLKDIMPDDAYNVVDLTYETQMEEKDLAALERRSNFKLVVDNGDVKLEQSDDQEKPDGESPEG